MPKCTIDGKEVEFAPGENLIKVAKRGGVEIPVFCYHPGLSVVAQCRMCYVEIEKMPKLQTACSTLATDGMVVKTQSEAVQKGRAGTMEFLLLNHPLDCPICDKSGECDLQDNSYGHGNAYMRHSEDRRTYLDIDMGPVIQKNMNRCIHCTRCIRFGDEVAGIHEMVAIQRGNNVDITTIDGKQLQTAYAGNYSDICPTGSLTLKDFRFKKRAWMLKKTATVCEGCSKGCNMEIQHEGGVPYRCVPIENLEINRYWLCDEGRFNFNYTQDPTRIIRPWSRQASSDGHDREWSEALALLHLKLSRDSLAIFVGTDLTQEELLAVQDFRKTMAPNAPLFHFGTAGVNRTADDASEDGILRMKSKTSNLNGAEKLGIEPYTGQNVTSDLALVFRGGRAQMPAALMSGKIAKEVWGWGVFLESDKSVFHSILPGIAFTEKDGTIINHQGKEQKLKRAVKPAGECKSIAEMLMMLIHAKRGVA